MNIKDILNKIYSLKAVPKTNLNTVKFVLEKLGNPEKKLKIIHIAGTNGKGSTASILESILIESGYNTGKFTSPHILKFNERILYNREEIPDSKVIYYYKLIETIIEKYDIYLNFFEITTLIMFSYFNEMNVEYAVIETGLGGRLDATNAAKSIVSLITNISFDHTEILGNTLSEIAYEKAGIITSGELCIFSDNSPELLNAVKTQTSNYINVLNKYKDADIRLSNSDFHTKITINNINFDLPLFGIFQGRNFLLAYETAKFLGIDDKHIKEGINNIKWPGRFEIFSSDPLIILDAAHNVDSMNVLRNNLLSLYKKEDIILIISVLKDKNIQDIIPITENFSDNIFFTSLSEVARGLSSNELKNRIINLNLHSKFYFEDNLDTIMSKIKTLNKKIIVVCGSFYLISKYKQKFSNFN